MIDKLRGILPDEKGCFYISSDINRRYFTGFKSSAGILLICPKKAYLLIDFRYYESACDSVKNAEVVLLKNTISQVKEVLEKENLDKIYIEDSSFTVAELNSMLNNYSDFKIVSNKDLSGAIEKIRAVKSPEELQKMRKAQEIADKAFDYVCKNVIKVGTTEKEIALALDFYMLSNGAEAISFETIALTGENTSLPHGVPSERKVSAGDFVLMDFGAVYQGYHSDMTRTVAVGEPSDEMKKIYEIVLFAQLKCLDYAKSGIVCKDLDSTARDFIKSNGYGEFFGHGLGHSVGLEIHESPAANTRDETILTENMIMTIEPGIYLPKKFGVRIEDCVIITDKSYENLTKTKKELIIL